MSNEVDVALIIDWIAALRSGEYPQGQGRLRTNGLYCCLAVLCTISGMGKWESTERGWEYMGEGCVLPEVLGERVGLAYGQSIIYSDGEHSLVEMNDDGATFEEIANLIECYLLEPNLP